MPPLKPPPLPTKSATPQLIKNYIQYRIHLKALRTMTEPLPSLPPTERLSPRVLRILGGNPSKFTLQGTNTYLVGDGRARILIDTGEGKPIWRENLKKTLEAEGATLEKVLLTHWHPDHVGGVKDVKELVPGVKIFKSQLRPEPVHSDIVHGQVFETSGAKLRAFHSPGHTTDHMALVLEEEDAMFTGDNVLGHGTAVFEDLTAYMASLQGMSQQFKGRAYPGHGAVIDDGAGKIVEYIRHREEREEQVLGVLSGEGEQGWTSMEMVKVIYHEYPESLHGPAEGSLLQVLRKLDNDGRVRKGENGRWRLVERASL